MRFAVVGAGAIGAYLGAKLSVSGHDVSLIARGPHLQAMQTHGVRVRSPEGDFQAHPTATGDYDEVGEVDFVFLTVKAHSLPEVAPRLGPLLGPETAVVSTQNGIPWWYFQRHGGPWEGRRIARLDPHGTVSAAIAAERVIGCIAYPSASIAEPGVIDHLEGNRFSIGEPDGSTSGRCRRLSGALKESGLRGPIRSRIRADVWVKLLGNVAFNPISALTRATLGRNNRPSPGACPGPVHHARGRRRGQCHWRDGAGLNRPAYRRSRRGRPAQDLHAPGPRVRQAYGA